MGVKKIATSQSQAIKARETTVTLSLGDGLAYNWPLKEHLEQWDMGVSAVGFAPRTSQSYRSKDLLPPPPTRKAKKGRAAAARPHGEANGATQGLGGGYGAIGRVETLGDSRVQSLEEGMALCGHSPFLQLPREST